MALTTYCELDEIRSALGVGDVELSDAVLALPVYEIGLVRELSKVSVSLSAAFSVCKAIAEESRTDTQQALIDAVHLFAVYACARQVGVSLPLMAPKDIGDGKASVGRFAGEPYKETLRGVDEMYAASKASLVDAMNAYAGTSSGTSSTVPYTQFLVSSRSTDPVTGV